VRTLPKLDHRSPELARRLLSGPDSVVQRWLSNGASLDGWRIDVANMTGRYREVDVNREVARAVRRAVEEARPEGLVVAEHGHDFRDDLTGDGWHGVMDYAGFTRPMWCWLRGSAPPGELASSFIGVPVGVPRLGGRAVVDTMRRFRAGVPWPTVQHSWLPLDSHDTARFAVVAGSREAHLVGLGVQMTTPGVPMLWAGGELGLGGEWGEDARRPIPWSRPQTWDTRLLESVRALARLRRSSRALAHGGIRYVHVDDDAIAYLRETREERVLCLARRAAGPPLELPLAELGGHELETLVGDDAAVTGEAVRVPAPGPAFHAWRIE
jgi:alpha-glucosidase